MFREKRLIRRINAGDPHVWRQLYNLYKDDMMTLAKALLFDREMAEDVVHDVFVQLVQQRESLHIKRNLRAYLLSAAANTARRINCKKKPILTQLPDTESLIASPEHVLSQQEWQDRLARALVQLPYEQREVVLLRHYGNLKFKTIGEIFAVSTNTIQGRYRYGLRKLKSLLEGSL